MPLDEKSYKLLNACAKGNLGTVTAMVNFHEQLDEHDAETTVTKPRTKEFVDHGDYDGRCAIHLAAANNQKEICTFLLRKKANINIADKFKGTAIEDASRNGHDHLVKFLKEQGAESTNIESNVLDFIRHASHGNVGEMERLHALNPQLVNKSDYDGRTPLHVAAQGGWDETVSWLITNGAELQRDVFGQTPLDDAHRTKARVGQDALSQMLQEKWNEQKARDDFEEEDVPHGNPLFWKIFLVVQIVIIILVFTCTKYDPAITTGSPNASVYPMFQDVHVMIFVGFGFLMTFLRKYGFSAVGLNFVVAALAIQWHLLVGSFAHQLTDVGFHHADWHKVEINLNSFLLGDFAAATVLISFGALLGKVSPSQLLVLAMLEIVFFSFNESISVVSWKASDMGGSMVVHVFGAYFGLAASWVLTTKAATKRSENSSDYRSDLFAMIGTLFLWVFWPSFTGAPASAYSSERVVVNTLLALTGSALTGFCFSCWLRGENKFDMVDVQNATLAGGVAIGTCCDMYVTPGGALTVGCFAGAWSVFGYTRIQGALETHCSIFDTCGVNNLHGMPGIIAGIVGFLVTAGSDKDDLGGDCVTSKVWGGRYSDASDCCASPVATCIEVRSAGTQAGVQIGFLAMTLVNAIVGGIITGYLVKHIEPIRDDGAKAFTDDENWEVPQLETPYYFDPRGAIRKAKKKLTDYDDGSDTVTAQQGLADAPEFGANKAVSSSQDDSVIATKLDQLYSLLLKNKKE